MGAVDDGGAMRSEQAKEVVLGFFLVYSGIFYSNSQQFTSFFGSPLTSSVLSGTDRPRATCQREDFPNLERRFQKASGNFRGH